MGLKVDKVVKTNILTIGGGGAAVSAAVASCKKGEKVTLVSKGKVGRSGNTIMIGGGFSIDGESARKVCGIEEANADYTKDALFSKTVKNSFYLSDQNIVQQFVDEAPEAVKECLEWAKNAGQLFMYAPTTSAWRTSGRSFGNTVAQGLKENPGIEVYEDTVVVDIIVSGGTVTGALGIDVYSGEIILFEAKAVILATGGYQPFTLKNSISDMTGDGVAMAYRAGAKIADMEFQLFIPTIVEPKNFRGSILPYLFTIPLFFPELVKVTDALGKELVIPEEFNKISRGNKLCKLLYAYYWGKGIFQHYKEHGNTLYYDFSNFSDKDIEDIFEELKKKYSLWHAKGHYNKIDLEELKQIIIRDRKLKVGLGCEYSMGGIEINEKMHTDINGLFAAGEVTSGLFGAFRGGDGLTEMLAHGVKAGTSAVDYVKSKPEVKVDIQAVEKILEEIAQPINRKEGISPYKVQEGLEKAADSGFNFFRNEEGLKKALEETVRIKNEEVSNMYVASKSRSYNFEWITSILARNILICNETGIRAALLRKESRGCHMRTDYPQVNNDEWLVKIEAQRAGEEIRLTTRKPVVTKLPLPNKSYASIPEHVLDNI